MFSQLLLTVTYSNICRNEYTITNFNKWKQEKEVLSHTYTYTVPDYT